MNRTLVVCFDLLKTYFQNRQNNPGNYIKKPIMSILKDKQIHFYENEKQFQVRVFDLMNKLMTGFSLQARPHLSSTFWNENFREFTLVQNRPPIGSQQLCMVTKTELYLETLQVGTIQFPSGASAHNGIFGPSKNIFSYWYFSNAVNSRFKKGLKFT